MTTAPTDPLLGRLVDGRYDVRAHIARGGMATVYLAHDIRLDRPVALKIMHVHLASGPTREQFIARFQREARAAARLTHPAIVAVYDQGCDGDLSYLAMEYVPGVTLRHLLHTEGPLTLARCFELLQLICEPLASAHDLNMVHRDIKPENVLVTPDGRVRITDFGLARAVGESTHTATGTVMGTVAYLAPELIATGTSDARSDVYAIGIMAYEMMTGQLPHHGESAIHVAFQHVNTDVPPPSEVMPQLPADIDELVCALTARDPAERPAHARSALALLSATRQSLGDTELHSPLVASSLVTPRPQSIQVTAERTTTFISYRPTPLPHRSQERQSPPTTMRHAPLPAPTAKPSRRRQVTLLSIVIALIIGSGITMAFTVGPWAYTTVPDGLVNESEADASSTITAQGLTPQVTHENHDTVPAGTVISTQPASGSRIPKDGIVTLSVSRGVLQVTAPETLVGISPEALTAALRSAGFTALDSVTQYSDDVPKGQVIAVQDGQEPLTPGATLPHNTKITITTSQGPAPIVVADVGGKPEAEARIALTEQGLNLVAESEPSETVPQGHVIRQSPAPGSDAHRTDAATIVVSTGPPLVDVPYLHTRNVKEARELLEAAGFTVKVTYPKTIHPFNMVYGQSPEGGDGKKAPKGSTVTLEVF